MLGPVIIATLVLSALFPGAPWLFGRRWGRKGVWTGTGAALVLLALFTPAFDYACVAENCGQGGIAIFFLAPIWALSALFTLLSATLAHRRCVG